MNALETRTRETRQKGRKLLAPYVTGGITDDWTDYLRAYQDAGADLIEIGLPFSDPTLDGPTVQQASDRALSRGTTVDGILADLAKLDPAVPLVTMTYANLVLRNGADSFCAALREAGVSGLIVPDMPVDEVAPLSEAAARHGIDLVLLAAPSTTPDRLRVIAGHSRGFVYAVSLMGTTGEKRDLPESGRALARSLTELTDLPVLVGFGVSRPDHAAEAARYADGVIVGSALMRKVLDGGRAEDLRAELADMRTALDAIAD
ncbi:tryptophan synthase, alpha chain [Amycolatopsis xylanica]|uniref:Tryptophan synthase alpha chain n=1 Tax=Amycolatopsis xylanica TaxID=589385 RepID=A0A1H3RLL9_9PSEU|nr:tryptophan synthase subunit alpha [Amycolatopsis xylanica]SDZ26255.1 tryptophan synthase, alpha chain [Amycolatopsis xylanica]